MDDAPPPFADGYDRVGPLHPYMAFAGVLLLDLVLALILLSIVAMVGDTIEDVLFPGGIDWIREL